MGDLLPWIRHNRVQGIHELVESQFMEKAIGLLSISVEDGGLFPLEEFFIS